jgi:uncharacterized membrane protein (DUF485 family)
MNGGSTSTTQEAAMRTARYQRAVQSAHRRLELAERRRAFATFIYVIAAVWAPMAFWSWVLNAPLHGAWIPVGWGLILGSVATLLWVRFLVLRRVRLIRGRDQEIRS